ncbi:MFS transporter [Halovivax sp.]|uniref:MFS transporter n=1 Tax=Halovivax sp. TaxID=1935978 RepID=UPI0025C6AB2A|nr:MFS transporter [Halovivax sp.]
MSFTSALSDREFRTLWTAQLVSKLGNVIHEIALIYLVYVVTGEPLLIAAVAVASLGSTAVFTLPAGALVDRWNRARALVAASVLRGVAILCIPIAANTGYLIEVAILAALVAGIGQAFVGPARDAVVPQIVPESTLDSANALIQMTDSFAKTLYVFAGLLVAIVGPIAAFYVNAATFFVAAALLSRLRVPHPSTGSADVGAGQRDRSVIDEIRDGMTYLITHPVLPSVLLLTGVVGLALGPLAIVIPFYGEQALGVEANGGVGTGNLATTFGLLYTAVYVGVFLGGGIVNGIRKDIRRHRGLGIVLGVFLMGTTLAGLAVAPALVGRTLGIATLLLLVFGISAAIVQVLTTTYVQRALPEDRHGKVFSLISIAAVSTPPLGIFLAGIGIEVASVYVVLIGQGVLMVLTAFALLGTPIGKLGDRASKTVTEPTAQ